MGNHESHCANQSEHTSLRNVASHVFQVKGRGTGACERTPLRSSDSKSWSTTSFLGGEVHAQSFRDLTSLESVDKFASSTEMRCSSFCTYPARRPGCETDASYSQNRPFLTQNSHCGRVRLQRDFRRRQVRQLRRSQSYWACFEHWCFRPLTYGVELGADAARSTESGVRLLPGLVKWSRSCSFRDIWQSFMEGGQRGDTRRLWRCRPFRSPL
jgi:hypothetical protein